MESASTSSFTSTSLVILGSSAIASERAKRSPAKLPSPSPKKKDGKAVGMTSKKIEFKEVSKKVEESVFVRSRSVQRSRPRSCSRPRCYPRSTSDDLDEAFIKNWTRGQRTDFASLQLPEHDRKILTRLALKTEKEVEAQRFAQEQHGLWREERLRMESEKVEKEAEIQRKLALKRDRLNRENEQRLEEARRKFLESQAILRRLIQEKEERSKRVYEELQMQRKCAKYRMAQESRRLAMQDALEELLARDTKYREALNAHIEQKLQQAQTNRQSRLEGFKKTISDQLTSEAERHQQQRQEMDLAHRKWLSHMRRSIRIKQDRVDNFRALREKTVIDLRLHREMKCRRVFLLKKELDDKLDEWRNKVLKVQEESIRQAEERASAKWEERRERVASENRERSHRHQKLLREAEVTEAAAERAERERIEVKNEKVDLLIKEREDERQRSRMHAIRMAKLREAVRSRVTVIDRRQYRSTTRQIQ